MSQNLQNIAKFQKFQLENLVDFEKCCKTHILLQKSEPIQPKTSNILPKFCQPTLSDVSAVRVVSREPRLGPWTEPSTSVGASLDGWSSIWASERSESLSSVSTRRLPQPTRSMRSFSYA